MANTIVTGDTEYINKPTLTLQDHSLLDALLEPAILASISLRLRYLTVAVRHARVHPPVLHGPFKKSLASLTRDNPVVQTGGFVLADHAYHGLFLLLCRFL